MLFANLPRPMIFAHRGASAYAPENTLAAFEVAVEQKADAIELDAHITADGHVVVIHDDTVDRTTNGTGKVIELSLHDIQQLDAGSSFHRIFRGEHIPTLEDIFAMIGKRIFINIELKEKGFRASSLPEKIASLLRKYDLSDSVLISSFNINDLRSIHKILPEISIALLARRGSAGLLARSRIGFSLIKYQALHPRYSDTTRELVKKQHLSGRRVNVYTVDQPEAIRSLLQLGVDGIFTNDPLTGRQVINQYQANNQANS
jgi:glycerophosphoryl diester phosphodiesterase